MAVLLVVVLIAIPQAIKTSTINKPLNYLGSSGSDVFVLPTGVDDYVSNSEVTDSQLAQFQHLPSVRTAQGTILSCT